MKIIFAAIFTLMPISLIAKDNDPELTEVCKNETSVIVLDLTIDLKGKVTDIVFVCDNPKGLYQSNKGSYDKAALNWKFQEQMEGGKHRYILHVD